MKNLSLYFIFFLISGISLAQSKKETIAILTNRVDSLNQIVASERSDKQKLNSEILNLKSQIKELERNKENLSNDKSALEIKNNALNQELQENKSLKEVLNKQLKIKQDSLVLVTTELLKYRPSPKQELVVKQDNTGPIKTVTIGKQVWMLENLNVSTFKNGVAIPEVQDKNAWETAGENQQPAWGYYDNDPKNGAKYGKLYNWYAVIDNNGLCPLGWHVPSDAEWDTLVTYLGGEDVAGDKMKSKSGWNKWDEENNITCPVCDSWNDEYRSKKSCHRCKDTRSIGTTVVYHSGDGNNMSGFTGLPGGNCSSSTYYSNIGDIGGWWSSTEDSTDYAWGRYLYLGGVGAARDDVDKTYGFSVRCLRD